MRKRVAVVDEGGVEAGDAGSAFDRGDDGGAVAKLCFRLDAAGEQAADDAFVVEGTVALYPVYNRPVQPRNCRSILLGKLV